MKKNHRENGNFEQHLRETYPNLESVQTGSSQAAGSKSRQIYTRWLTPVEDFFILNHHSTPSIDADDWTVSLTGIVDDDARLTMDEIRNEFPAVTVAHTMECAGNGRALLQPQGPNAALAQWEYNAAGNAVWTGAPLSLVLETYGADVDDTWLTAVGGDAPEDEDADVFARSIPMSKVLDDCILAYEMNGDLLPPDHGYPVRLVVPGWYGVNSVKWVEELRVMDSMIHGEAWERYTRWQQRSYRIMPEGVEDPPEHSSIDEFDTQTQIESDEVDYPYAYDQNVMSLIGHPDDGTVVRPRRDNHVEVVGVTWGGDEGVDSVAVSTDDGETWEDAKFLGPDMGSGTWRLFRYLWDADDGTYTLMSRATDGQGRTQPLRSGSPDEGLTAIEDDVYPWNQRGYGNNASLDYAVKVTVEKRQG